MTRSRRRRRTAAQLLSVPLFESSSRPIVVESGGALQITVVQSADGGAFFVHGSHPPSHAVSAKTSYLTAFPCAMTRFDRDSVSYRVDTVRFSFVRVGWCCWGQPATSRHCALCKTRRLLFATSNSW